MSNPDRGREHFVQRIVQRWWVFAFVAQPRAPWRNGAIRRSPAPKCARALLLVRRVHNARRTRRRALCLAELVTLNETGDRAM